ncbi:type II secretion system protein [Burkholderia diffusa]|uniref:type II secretion system protein n=1 Tax=Burkholderia diffusa TaxID=488732 RepID=UPI000A9ED66B|nr:hypothetical protein [Burkholderia diffusa]
MKQRGFTILELTLVLITFGLLISTIVTLLNASTNPTSTTGQSVAETTLSNADRAVVGYALANYIFPEPVADAPININGLIPGQLAADALGLATSPKTWYWIDARLLDPSPYQVDPDNLTQGALPSRGAASLVDLCSALKTVQASPSGMLAGVPVAAILATNSANGSTTVPSTLPLPGSSAALQLEAQGFSISALGPAELIGRLHCPRTLGAVTSNMRAVAIANDLLTWASDLVNFRNLELASDQQTDFSNKLRLALAIATLTALSADTLSYSAQIALAAIDARSPLDAVTVANLLVGLQSLVGTIGYVSAQVNLIKNDLEKAPSNVANDQIALGWANQLYNNAQSALTNAQSAYSWSLMGL